MTSYNRGHYIGQAIDSILAQECSFPIEIIIGDDGSTDNSRELLSQYYEKYPDIIVLNFQEHNVGFGPNWASTCKLARGKYIAFLDDDDYYCDTHRLTDFVEVFEKNPQYGLLHTSYYRLEIKTGKMILENNPPDETLDQLSSVHSGRYPMCFGTACIRKELMDKYVNLDDYIRDGFTIQDWPTEMLLARHTKFGYISTPSYVYRIHEGSMSHPQTYETLLNKYTKETDMYRYICETTGEGYNEKGWWSSVYTRLLGLAYQKRDFENAKKYAQVIGGKRLKVLCTKTRITFWAFIIAKKVWHKIRHLF